MAMTELITRINRIFDNILGCQLEFQPADKLTVSDWNESDLLLLQTERAPLPKFVESPTKGTFGFPVNSQGSFAGLAVIKGVDHSKPRKLLHMAELFTLVLEAGLQQEERRERLRMIEERLHLIDESSNVIPLRPARYGKVLQLVDTTQVEMAPLAPLTSLPLLIETKPGFPLHRVAIEVHGKSQRWAFIGLEDLPTDVLNSRESIEELGSMTIFIKDLTQLSLEKQEKLADYLETEPGADKPHIIAGTTELVADLRASGRVIARLADLFCVSNLQWTDKTSEQITTDLVNASLRHLVEQTRDEHRVGNNFIPFHIKYFDPNHTSVH